MPAPSPTVTTAPTTSTVIQCLPRLSPSHDQTRCTRRLLPAPVGDRTLPTRRGSGTGSEALVSRAAPRSRRATLDAPLGRVAELADAQASGACVRKDVGVQVPPRPPRVHDTTALICRQNWSVEALVGPVDQLVGCARAVGPGLVPMRGCDRAAHGAPGRAESRFRCVPADARACFMAGGLRWARARAGASGSSWSSAAVGGAAVWCRSRRVPRGRGTSGSSGGCPRGAVAR